MYKASVDTQKFSFVAFGHTEESVRAALRAGLKKHADQYLSSQVDGGAGWVKDVLEDANILEFKDGDCFRDTHRISRMHQASSPQGLELLRTELCAFVDNESDQGAADGFATNIADQLLVKLENKQFDLENLSVIQLALVDYVFEEARFNDNTPEDQTGSE